MAFSPTTHPASLAGASYGGSSNQVYRADRRSPSPSNQQSVNKRDKRRIALQDRLNDIISNFSNNRDLYYRKQLQQYQTDIHFVSNAALYDNQPLLEPGEEEQDGATRNSARPSRLGLSNGSAKIDSYPKLGRQATSFIEEVNDAMEQRDADLVTLAYRHNYAVNQLDKDYCFSVEVAEREHQRLIDSLRQRLIQNVNQKITTLQRDKEKLDIADTNALLHHPTQFSINNVASPGGPQSNRKTRHTRHRLEVEDVDTAINSNNNKRKRKNAIADSRNPSPGPTASRDPVVAAITDQNLTNGAKDNVPFRPILSAPAMTYTLDRLFTDRELTANLQQATYDIIQSHAAKRRRSHLAASNDAPVTDAHLPGSSADVAAGSIEATDEHPLTAEYAFPLPHAIEHSDNPFGLSTPIPATAAAAVAAPGAPSMERTPSQLYHATRSANTRGGVGSNHVLLASTLTAGTAGTHAAPHAATLGTLAGRSAAADLIGSYDTGPSSSSRRGADKAKRDGDEYQRASALGEADALEDLRLMEEAIRAEDEGFGLRGEGTAVGIASAAGAGAAGGGGGHRGDVDMDVDTGGGGGGGGAAGPTITTTMRDDDGGMEGISGSGPGYGYGYGYSYGYGTNAARGGVAAAGAKGILDLVLGDEMRDWVGPAGFAARRGGDDDEGRRGMMDTV